MDVLADVGIGLLLEDVVGHLLRELVNLLPLTWRSSVTVTGFPSLARKRLTRPSLWCQRPLPASLEARNEIFDCQWPAASRARCMGSGIR